MTEQDAVEVLLGKPPEVQKQNELERQFTLIRHALQDGRLIAWNHYEQPLWAKHFTITFTLRVEP